MIEGKKVLAGYVNAAEDLALTIKDNIQHGEKITPETLSALNRFIMASNAVKDLTEELKKSVPQQH